MATITNSDIEVRIAPVQKVALRAGSMVESSRVPADPESIVLKQYHPDFAAVVGKKPVYSLLLSSAESSQNPFFHDGCAYLPEQDELYLTSDLLQSTNSSKLPIILISKVSFKRASAASTADSRLSSPPHIAAAEWMKLRPPPSMAMPAGVAAYQDGVLYCSQGTLAPESGGLWYMAPAKAPLPIVKHYFNKPFNSIHSVTHDKEGGLWFTDPSIGFERDIRPEPQLPSQVYRFDPKTSDLRAVADGFGRPSGIAMSSDEGTLYVSDTGALRPDGTIDSTGAATIYAFDVLTRFGSPFLANRRVFAYALSGVPTALACDRNDNVHASCTDGVEIWSPGGMALGLIVISGGCSNLCFGRQGELFICAEQRLWRVQLEASGGGLSYSHPS